MSGQQDADEEYNYKTPYSARHPIPTISKYRQERDARQERALQNGISDDFDDAERSGQHGGQGNEVDQLTSGEAHQDENEDGEDDENEEEAAEDTSQVDPGSSDPRQRRKEMKKNKRERAEREVTDPITHLPVTIHDFTDKALKEVDLNDSPFGSTTRTSTGFGNKNKSNEQLHKETKELQHDHDAMSELFPPPDFDALRIELATISKRGVTFGLTGAVIIIASALAVEKFLRLEKPLDGKDSIPWMGSAIWLIVVTASIGTLWFLIIGVRDWMAKRIHSVFQDEVWDAQRQKMRQQSTRHKSESTVWLNSLLGSVWPLVNPDLFTSLADTLEDVMQASLPKLVRMVSVDDIGQGSESIRILGIRWLPTGAAARAVGQDGKLKTAEESGNESDVKCAGEAADDGQKEEDEDNKDETLQGMEAEEGDFINLEIAFAYRSRSSSKTLKERTKDMHLYLAFYLPGNIKLPVWVDLQGIVGTMRVRLQLTPDPPFFALCTLTFLGQPKVDVSCVPLNKHGLNIMDVPLISKFVQSAVDAAMAEYVAPKSLTIDLKDMLAGEDFKKDTIAKGVIVINIKRGYDFKMGDTGIPLIKDGTSDPYVTMGWAKFGKVLQSTRILQSEMEPYWDETFFLPVTPEELHIGERLRLQLWDSDRLTADDDLGRIEVDLKKIMRDEATNGRMATRTDGFKALKSGDGMPGKLEWSVGYFSKTRMQQCQFDQQSHDPEIRNMDKLKEKVDRSCERKLRETMFREGQRERDQSELEQQKAQGLQTEQDLMIISAPPPDKYPSGLFSLQIHNITGLELERLNKTSGKEAEVSDEDEAGEGLPSAYCTIIINHKKTFKTRTKPQNAKPFYNAGCERFIRDWRECEVYVSVRDSRLHEDDPLLGIVHLPLGDLFQQRSQVMGFWPLTGGIGHGRIKLSMVWRSVQLQAPRNLLGWQYGTVEVQPTVTVSDVPQNLSSNKLKLRTNISSGKMYASNDGQTWKTKRDKSIALAVHSRYNSCLSIAFRDKGVISDDTAAFSVLWLKDLIDDEEMDIELPVWKGNFKRATASSIENCGEKIGSMKLRIKFWSGMVSFCARTSFVHIFKL